MNTEMSIDKKLPGLNKRTVAVLTETQMTDVNGGSSPVCIGLLYSSEVCATATAAATVVLYQIVVGG